ncbi:S-adenosyl-L-methionine-dependent methyltransferase [Tricladium varicosporioides]|nr:S-adenosyl-L-methionine-dependent methyltransferase [Hymenoscyphus varicosporioides]
MAQMEPVDHWSSEKYQNAASFVPKLATKVLEWLDIEKDDVILDVGCGDGVLNLQIAEVLSRGTGKIHGIDSSPAMISAAQKSVLSNPSISKICTFEVIDAASISQKPSLQNQTFDKVFSNAAMHWILRPESTRESFFRGVHAALKPNGSFVFEMGGMGNVAEMRTALLLTVSRRVGLPAALKADPWFFPDEIWMTRMLEDTVGGFKVERIEREYRPTRADEGGIEGWVRLMGKQFFDVVNEEEREYCIKECLGVLESVCNSPGGGDWLGYVRLRAVVKKI